MGDTLDQLATAANADVNVVLSSTAFYLAQYLRDTYGIPYVVGIPMGEKGTADWLEALRNCDSSYLTGFTGQENILEPSMPWPTSTPGRRNRPTTIRRATSWSSVNRSTCCR